MGSSSVDMRRLPQRDRDGFACGNFRCRVGRGSRCPLVLRPALAVVNVRRSPCTDFLTGGFCFVISSP